MQKTGDEILVVEFYRKLWQNPSESILQGRPIFQEREWIRILTPGNTLNVIDTLAEDHYKVRFSKEYQNFLDASVDHEVINGTPLASWSAITREVAEKLRYKKFYTIEQVAGASDAQLMSIGMDVGMQPHDFKRLASAYLESSAKTGDIMRREAELDLIRNDNDDLRAQNIDLSNTIKQMQVQMNAMAAQMTQMAPAAPKRSHKKKVVPKEEVSEDSIET